MEQRLKTMLDAIKLVQPALESFYGSLTDEQKARFNLLGSQQG
jgi:LTXXQ motif family protein